MFRCICHAALALAAGCHTPRTPSPSQPTHHRVTASTWRCAAAGNLSTGDVRSTFGDGPSRDHASRIALGDCNALMTRSVALAMFAGEKRARNECTVVRCIAPGR